MRHRDPRAPRFDPAPSAESCDTYAGAVNDADCLARLVDKLVPDRRVRLDLMDIAEVQIAAAQRHYPAAEHVLFHCFGLLQATTSTMTYADWVYAAHCRELLDRVAAGAATEPATAVEVLCMLSTISKATPVQATATGLSLRMWRLAFPHRHRHLSRGTGTDYDELAHKSAIEAAEHETRTRLAIADRTLSGLTCDGRHLSLPVACPLAANSTP